MRKKRKDAEMKRFLKRWIFETFFKKETKISFITDPLTRMVHCQIKMFGEVVGDQVVARDVKRMIAPNYRGNIRGKFKH